MSARTNPMRPKLTVPPEVLRRIEALTAERDALKAAAEWQPIETAPKDGTEILGFGQWAGEIHGPQAGSLVLLIGWVGSSDYPGFDWSVSGGDAYACWCKPTHWMPLPKPPVTP